MKQNAHNAAQEKLPRYERILQSRIDSGIVRKSYPDRFLILFEKLDTAAFARFCVEIKAWWTSIRLKPENSKVRWSDDRSQWWYIKEDVVEAEEFIEFTISWCHKNFPESKELSQSAIKELAIFLVIERNHVEFLLGEETSQKLIQDCKDKSDFSGEKFLRKHFAPKSERSLQKMNQQNSKLQSLLPND